MDLKGAPVVDVASSSSIFVTQMLALVDDEAPATATWSSVMHPNGMASYERLTYFSTGILAAWATFARMEDTASDAST